MNLYFELIVRDKFDLSDGRTIFVGDLLGYNGDIKPCLCEVYFQNLKCQTISIYPEIPSITKQGYRAISTMDKLNIKDINFNSGEMVLKFIRLM